MGDFLQLSIELKHISLHELLLFVIFDVIFHHVVFCVQHPFRINELKNNKGR